MLKPKRDSNSTQSTYSKFARIFALLMTLLYIGLGIFIMFAADRLRIDIPEAMKYMLGGILILYGVVRFVRVYNSNRPNRNRYED